MIKAHSNQRYSIDSEDVKKCEYNLITKFNKMSREQIEYGFLNYLDTAQTSPALMKLNACYGANLFLSKYDNHDINLWKAHMSSITSRSIIGMIIGDLSSSGYNNIFSACDEVLSLFDSFVK